MGAKRRKKRGIKRKAVLSKIMERTAQNRVIFGAGTKKKKSRNPHGYWIFRWRSGWDSNPRAREDYLISSLVRTWHFRVCCGRWRQFWKRRKSLCCNGFRTHRPVLTSSISEKTRVQIEMRNAPKRSIFLRAGKKTCKKKTLVRYGFADRPPD